MTAGGHHHSTTTGVSLSDLAAASELQLHWIFGEAEGSRLVRWSHSTELVDPSPYLKGGELVCTVGAALADADSCNRFVRNLITARPAGLCFGLGDVHQAVPEELAKACARHVLPLLGAPHGVPFEAISEYLAGRQVILEAERTERSDELLSGLLAQLRLGATAEDLVASAQTGLGGRLEVHSPAPERQSPINSEITASLSSGDTLSWTGAPPYAAHDLLDQIARIVDVAAHERDVEATYRWERIGQLIVMVGDGLAVPRSLAPLLEEAGVRRDRIVASAWPSGAASLLSTRLSRALIGQTSTLTIALTNTSTIITDAAAEFSLACGFGNALPLDDVGHSITQARAALQLAQRKHQPVGPTALTTLEGLLAQQQPQLLQPFIDELIAPIKMLSRSEQSTHLDTLRRFLRNGGQLQKTASETFMHVNTVRKRLNRIHLVTGRNPLDFQDRVALAIALWAHDRRSGEPSEQ